MIKKTRIKFVAVTMTLLAVIVIILAGLIIGISYRNNRRDVEKQLREKLDAPLMKPNVPGKFEEARSFALIVSLADDYVIWNIDNYSQYFDAEQLKQYVKTIIEADVTRGRIDDLYYAAEQRGQYFIIAGVDMSVEESFLRSMTNITVFTVIGGLLILFAVVWGLSYIIIKPVEEAFEGQKRFISDASHELKTPLTIINANADVLKSENGGNEWIENIRSQTERMTVLVTDMLSLARLEENSVVEVKSRFDLSNAVENAVLSFEALAYEAGKKYNTEIRPSIQYVGLEEDVLKMCNLLCDNAVKYAAEKISVSLETRGGRPVFRTVNDGCMIPSADSEKIFLRFYRGDSSRDRTTGGSGLGLAVVKALADKNKWKITVICSRGGNMDISVEL